MATVPNHDRVDDATLKGLRLWGIFRRRLKRIEIAPWKGHDAILRVCCLVVNVDGLSVGESVCGGAVPGHSRMPLQRRIGE